MTREDYDKLIKEQGSPYGDRRLLDFFNCNYKTYGRTLEISFKGLLGINYVDVAMETYGILTEPIHIQFDKEIIADGKNATYDEITKELTIDGSIYKITDTYEFDLFVTDLHGDTTKALANLMNNFINQFVIRH